MLTFNSLRFDKDKNRLLVKDLAISYSKKDFLTMCNNIKGVMTENDEYLIFKCRNEMVLKYDRQNKIFDVSQAPALMKFR
jgi:hypothetical protein